MLDEGILARGWYNCTVKRFMKARWRAWVPRRCNVGLQASIRNNIAVVWGELFGGATWFCNVEIAWNCMTSYVNSCIVEAELQQAVLWPCWPFSSVATSDSHLWAHGTSSLQHPSDCLFCYQFKELWWENGKKHVKVQHSSTTKKCRKLFKNVLLFLPSSASSEFERQPNVTDAPDLERHQLSVNSLLEDFNEAKVKVG